MTVEKTVIDNLRIITPKVTTKTLVVDGVTINKISQVVADEQDAIPVGSALQTWLNTVLVDIDDRLTEFENETIVSYTHPATHPASMITETATRVWLTTDLRDKLDSIATGANNYVHPATHSADMINESATRVWLTPELRNKLNGIAVGANNYTHPLTHPASMIEGFLTPDGFVNAEFIKELSVQRINNRHNVQTGFIYTGPGVDYNDYTNAPIISIVDLGTNEFAIRVTPTVSNPLIAVISNGFNTTIGNVDSIVVCTEVITTPSIVSYGTFVPGDEVYVILKKDKTLYLSKTYTFDSSSMISTPVEEVPIAMIKIGDNNDVISLVPAIRNKYQTTITNYLPYTTQSVSIGNRLFTEQVHIQILRQQQGQTDWTVVNGYTNTPNQYNVYPVIGKYEIILHTPNYISEGMPEARFKINLIRAF